MQEISQNPAPKASDATPNTPQWVSQKRIKANSVAWEAKKQHEKILKKSKLNSLTLGIAAFIIAAWVGIAFFLLSLIREGTVHSLQEEVQDIRRQITEIKKDKNVLIANILKNNAIQSSLPLKQIISDFQLAAQQSNVQLQGFNIQDGVITTTLIAKEHNEAHSDPAITIINMMRNYSKNKNTSFNLEPITSISGNPNERTTQISFKIMHSNKK